MKKRLALRQAVAWTGLWLLAAGCTVAPSERAPRPLSADQARYVLDPSELAPVAVAERFAGIHRRLLAGESPAALRRELEARPAGTAENAVIDLTLALLDFVDGDEAAAAARLAKLGPAARSTAAARLLAARLAELAGRPADSFELYDALAGELPVAAERRETQRASAEAELLASIDAAIASRRLDDAAEDLARLERVAPRRNATFERMARVAAARGDLASELIAVRALAAAHPERLDLQLRRAELEAEVGDAAAGLALLGELAAAHPGDVAVAAGLVRGKFLYRLANAPDAVRRVVERVELSRGDFARLIYWLEPGVRSARPAATRIATDVLDHPAREEILRVANLGLMRIDEALHVFEPDRPLTRADAFLALARLRGLHAESRAEACRVALEAGWIPESAACLPAAPVAGGEALDWLRRSGARDGEG